MKNDVHFLKGVNELFGVITLICTQRDFGLRVVGGLPGVVNSIALAASRSAKPSAAVTMALAISP